MDKARLKEEIIRDEGLRVELYIDSVGKATIGVGRNIEDNGISKEEAFMMLENDLAVTESELNFRIPWWRDLPDDAQRALANMCFNLGVTRLLKFKKFLGAIEDHDWNKAAVEMLDSRWAIQVGPRAIRLKDRVNY